MNTRRIHGYCALCVARCGTVATVEDGRFTRLDPDPTHPTGQAICAKGRAAPELDPSKGRSRPGLGTDPLGLQEGNPGLGGAIANAVCDALPSGNLGITALPLTPARVFLAGRPAHAP